MYDRTENRTSVINLADKSLKYDLLKIFLSFGWFFFSLIYLIFLCSPLIVPSF